MLLTALLTFIIHVYNFHQMLSEIFSHLSHNKRLKMSLVCKKWKDNVMIQRLNVVDKEIGLKAWEKFLDIFTDRSVSLPLRSIQIEDVDDKTPMSILEPIPEYINLNIRIRTTLNPEKFLKFIKTLPEKFNIIWKLDAKDVSDEFQKYWLQIFNVAESKKIEVALHANWYSPQEDNHKVLSILMNQTLP